MELYIVPCSDGSPSLNNSTYENFAVSTRCQKIKSFCLTGTLPLDPQLKGSAAAGPHWGGGTCSLFSFFRQPIQVYIVCHT